MASFLQRVISEHSPEAMDSSGAFFKFRGGMPFCLLLCRRMLPVRGARAF